jgi:hypothetical protein
MVAINEILLPECTGEGCSGETGTCPDSRVHRRNAEDRAPVTGNHRGAPSLGRWMEQDPAQFINGANTYQFVNSSPVGMVDPEGLYSETLGPSGMIFGFGPPTNPHGRQWWVARISAGWRLALLD